MKRIAFLLAGLYCLTACDNAVFDVQDFPANETQSRIELRMPDVETVNVYSMATVSENTIDELWVLVFNGNTKKWVEKFNGSEIFRNGQSTQILPQLKHMPVDGDTIICIANVDPNPDTVSVTPLTINACFKLEAKGYYKGTEFLPMSGGFRWSPASGCVCEMTRAVAKVQVRMGTSVSDVTGNFSADNVSYQIYHFGLKGTIQPTLPITGTPNTSGAHTSENFLLLQNSSASEANSNVYLYEYPSSTQNGLGSAPVGNSVFDADRQFLLLRKNNGVTSTYYRLDFYDPSTGTFFDTKRNHHYLFTINKVRSEGYQDINQAINYPGSNIEYDIRIDDGANRIASNGQYAIVVTSALDTFSFRARDNDAPYDINVSARYQLWEPSASLASGTINEISVASIPATNPSVFYDPSPAVLTDSKTPAPITIKVRPGTTPGTIGALTFRLGNITHQVIFKYSAVY